MVAFYTSIFNINLKSFLFIIFLSHHIFILSKIVIPFYYYNNNNESFISKYSEDLVYTEIKSGSYSTSPDGKKLTIFFNLKNSKFLIKTREVCPQTSYYNKNESTSYKYENKTSQDSFYFYTDIQTSSLKKYDAISFGYSENDNINTICGEMGLNMVNSFEKQNENIVYSLKNKKYIDNYYVSFKFNEKKPFDNYENLKGKIIIGEPPHEYDKNEFYFEQFKGDNAYVDSLTQYVLNFDKVYLGLKDKPKTILTNSDNINKFPVVFEFSYGLISGPDVYLDYIELNFFNKSEISNLCKKSKEKGKFLIMMHLYVRMI